jgi:hypothetical protein
MATKIAKNTKLNRRHNIKTLGREACKNMIFPSGRAMGS